MPVSNFYYKIYISFRKNECSEEDVQLILEKSRVNNKEKNITGVLLYNDNLFVQYLEGAKEDVFSVYEKIIDDKRHSFPLILNFGEHTDRMFPEWHMAEKKISWESLEFKTPINELMEKKFNTLLNSTEANKMLDTIAKLMK